MSSTEKLLQATINRLKERLTNKLVNSADEIALFAKDAPEKIKKEWAIFKEEVITEADQLDKKANEEVKKQETSYTTKSPQEKIELIRTKVASLNNKLEEKK